MKNRGKRLFQPFFHFFRIPALSFNLRIDIGLKHHKPDKGILVEFILHFILLLPQHGKTIRPHILCRPYMLISEGSWEFLQISFVPPFGIAPVLFHSIGNAKIINQHITLFTHDFPEVSQKSPHFYPRCRASRRYYIIAAFHSGDLFRPAYDKVIPFPIFTHFPGGFYHFI